MMSMNENIDLSFLSQEERDIILGVLQRDEDLRLHEENRKKELLVEISQLKRQSAIKVGQTQKARECIRCHKELGVIRNHGDVCPKCRHVVCITCRIDLEESRTYKWLCTLCHKQRLLPAVTGDWFFKQPILDDPNDLTPRASPVLNKTPPPVPPSVLIKTCISHAPISERSSIRQRTNPFSRPLPLGSTTSNRFQNTAGGLSGSPEVSRSDKHPKLSAAEKVEVRRIIRRSTSSDSEDTESDNEMSITPTNSLVDTYPIHPLLPDVTDHLTSNEVFHSVNGTDVPASSKARKPLAVTTSLEPLPTSEEMPPRELIRQRSKSLVPFNDDPESPDCEYTVEELTQIKFRRCSGDAAFNLKRSVARSRSLTSNSSLHSHDTLDSSQHPTPTPQPADSAVDADPSALNTVQKEKSSACPLPTISIIDDDDRQRVIALEELDRFDDAVCRSDGEEQDAFPDDEDIDNLFEEAKRTHIWRPTSTESLTSIYSEAGAMLSNHSISGDIQFSVQYSEASRTLTVKINQCRNLTAINEKKNTSDPYVKIYLLPDKSKYSKKKTRVKKNTLNPSYNESFAYIVSKNEDLSTRTLQVAVWNFHRLGYSEFLGEVTLPLVSENLKIAKESQWYNLEERLKADTMESNTRGELRLSIRYVLSSTLSAKAKNPGTGEIQVKVGEAKNLIGKKSSQHSDPFVKGILQPEKVGKLKKQKSKIVKNTVNPSWDETFKFSEVMLDELSECGLEITVWDYDRFSSNDFLGGLRLNTARGISYGQTATWMDAEGRELQAWHEMINNPDQWVDCWIPLRNSMSH